MTIEVLFNEICNLYGDPQNAEYLSKSLPGAKFIYTGINDTPFFADNKPNIILLGAMSEKTQRLVIKKLLPYKDRLFSLINDGIVFLATGNAYEVFTKKIDYVTEKKSVEGLGLFDLTVKTDLFKRYNGKVLGDCDGYTITGFRSQFSFTYGDNSDCYFLKMNRGIGINPKSTLEGVRLKNFFGTSTLGPVLPLNPLFCEHIMSLAGANAKAAFREVAVSAYEQRVKEFTDPKTHF